MNLEASQTLSEEARAMIKSKLQETTDFWNNALTTIEQ